ncbi:periplasmic nitrate reductase, NapE protein [Brackiella oedipodis]|uniref:periplasmic nitrate reductase, NapE protein n=1 Tax=Brackiella oedipodis TaxID=124225 RepID=UPI00056F21A9|nr:hypothetical protein [Brackiella oedipodis]
MGKASTTIKHHDHPSTDKPVAEWKRFLLMGFIVLPIVSLLLICAYGFIVWFGQMLIWGPPGP